MRVEGDKEFRIYCEDVEGCPIDIVTEGVLNLFADLCDDAPREADATSEQWGVTSGQRDSIGPAGVTLKPRAPELETRTSGPAFTGKPRSKVRVISRKRATGRRSFLHCFNAPHADTEFCLGLSVCTGTASDLSTPTANILFIRIAAGVGYLECSMLIISALSLSSSLSFSAPRGEQAEPEDLTFTKMGLVQGRQKLCS